MSESEEPEEQEMEGSRRRFIRLAVVGVGAAGITTLFSSKLIEAVGFSKGDVRAAAPARRQWVMLIDLKKCDGCRKCTEACNTEHFVPPGQEWITVYEVQDEFGFRYFLPRPCMHCENAPCLKVCPVGATFRREDGVVLVDHRRCIGCRYCMAACPYDVRAFNWSEPPHTPEELAHTYRPEAPWPHRMGVVEKCMFCAHRAEEGELPACVRGCPMDAIYFGDLREDAVSNGREVLRLSETLRRDHGFRLKEELGTEPRVWYLPARRD